jgi:uncharacterized protein
MELRYINDVEVRVEGTDAAPVITGYGIVFNSMSHKLGSFREIVKPGAVANLSSGDIRGRYNHQTVLGRTRSGTLKLTEDAKGVRYEITPTKSATSQHIIEAIRRGDVDGSSFAFRTVSDNWRKENGETIRELVKIELMDVGPVDFPAYPESSAGLRALSHDDEDFRKYAERKIAELNATPDRDALGKRLGY